MYRIRHKPPRFSVFAFCQGTPLHNEIEQRDPGLLAHVTDRAAEAIAEAHGEGEVSGKIQGHVIIAEA